MKQQVVKKVNNEEREVNTMNTQTTTKSQKIRELYDEGKSISEISRIMNVNYSFVYQTIKKYCDKIGKEFITRENKETKSQKIRELYLRGLSISQISKELQTNYNYVWSIVNKMKKVNNKGNWKIPFIIFTSNVAKIRNTLTKNTYENFRKIWYYFTIRTLDFHVVIFVETSYNIIVRRKI